MGRATPAVALAVALVAAALVAAAEVNWGSATDAPPVVGGRGPRPVEVAAAGAAALSLLADAVLAAHVLLGRNVFLFEPRPMWQSMPYLPWKAASAALGKLRTNTARSWGEALALALVAAPIVCFMVVFTMTERSLAGLAKPLALKTLLAWLPSYVQTCCTPTYLKAGAAYAIRVDLAVTLAVLAERAVRGWEVKRLCERCVGAGTAGLPPGVTDPLAKPVTAVLLGRGTELGAPDAAPKRLHRDICYATPAEVAAAGKEAKHLRLDVYSSDAAVKDGGRPVFVFIHGGGWTEGGGDKEGYASFRDVAPLMLQDAGWVGCSVDYRLTKMMGATPASCHWPAQLVDVKRAVRWVRENIAEYGGDPSWIATYGISAGGQLAFELAMTSERSEFQPGFEGVDTAVDACAAAYPCLDCLDDGRELKGDHVRRLFAGREGAAAHAEMRTASPLHLIDEWAGRPPRPVSVLLTAAACDTVCSVVAARAFASKARHAASTAEGRRRIGKFAYLELPRTEHGFDATPSTASPGTRAWLATAAAIRFFNDAFAERRRKRA